MKRWLPFLILPILALGCSRAKLISENRIEVASNTFVVVTKELHPGAIEASVHTYLAVKWPSARRLDAIAEADCYEGKEDIRLVSTKQHHILVYGRSLYVRPLVGGKWFWWPPQNALTIPPPPGNSIACYLKDWFVQRNWTNFSYEADGQFHEERINFQAPETTQAFTIGSGQNGVWRTMPYRFDSVYETANSVTYRADIPSLPRFLVFVGPPNYFGAWSFDRKATEEKNGGPNQQIHPIAGKPGSG